MIKNSNTKYNRTVIHAVNSTITKFVHNISNGLVFGGVDLHRNVWRNFSKPVGDKRYIKLQATKATYKFNRDIISKILETTLIKHQSDTKGFLRFLMWVHLCWLHLHLIISPVWGEQYITHANFISPVVHAQRCKHMMMLSLVEYDLMILCIAMKCGSWFYFYPLQITFCINKTMMKFQMFCVFNWHIWIRAIFFQR